MSFHFNLKNSLHHFLHNKSSGNELPFDFCLSGEAFISTLFLMDGFARYSIFGSQLFFCTLNIHNVPHTLSWPARFLMRNPLTDLCRGLGSPVCHLYVMTPFSLTIFKFSFFDFWHFDYNVSSEVLDVHPICASLGIMDLDVHYSPQIFEVFPLFL